MTCFEALSIAEADNLGASSTTKAVTPPAFSGRKTQKAGALPTSATRPRGGRGHTADLGMPTSAALAVRV
jgi:hypothetical protein